MISLCFYFLVCKLIMCYGAGLLEIKFVYLNHGPKVLNLFNVVRHVSLGSLHSQSQWPRYSCHLLSPTTYQASSLHPFLNSFHLSLSATTIPQNIISRPENYYITTARPEPMFMGVIMLLEKQISQDNVLNLNISDKNKHLLNISDQKSTNKVCLRLSNNNKLFV